MADNNQKDSVVNDQSGNQKSTKPSKPPKPSKPQIRTATEDLKNKS